MMIEKISIHNFGSIRIFRKMIAIGNKNKKIFSAMDLIFPLTFERVPNIPIAATPPGGNFFFSLIFLSNIFPFCAMVKKNESPLLVVPAISCESGGGGATFWFLFRIFERNFFHVSETSKKKSTGLVFGFTGIGSIKRLKRIRPNPKIPLMFKSRSTRANCSAESVLNGIAPKKAQMVRIKKPRDRRNVFAFLSRNHPSRYIQQAVIIQKAIKT